MIKPVFKKTYRVLEEVKDGRRSFFPQERCMYFFWKKIVEEGYSYIKYEFDTMDEANEFLYNRHIRDLNETEEEKAKRLNKKKINTKEVHDFDAVFYKLKNK